MKIFYAGRTANTNIGMWWCKSPHPLPFSQREKEFPLPSGEGQGEGDYRFFLNLTITRFLLHSDDVTTDILSESGMFCRSTSEHITCYLMPPAHSPVRIQNQM